MMKGYVDTPAGKDLFHIGRYVRGLTNFITECDTPMTIAIQGDWGSGKTSLMTMISDSLRKDHQEVVPIWFNTWQFSQFNLGDQLPIMMVSKLINSLGGTNDGTKEKAKKILSKVGDVALAHFTNGGTGIDAFTNIVNDITNGDLLDQFDNLRLTFQNLVDEKVKGTNGRVVFFIDDLDRLNPGKAIELLEVLKIFLECHNCVFVLAIDYNVVVRGIREKYKDIDEEKGKAFFDKIIQVPFRMPLEHYNIFEYVTSCLQDFGIHAGRFDVRTLDSLLINSVGNNPRSIKRIFNSYLLLREVSDERVLEDPHAQILLFAVLCMQNKFPKLYNYIIMQRQYLNTETIKAIEDRDSSVLEEIGYSEEQFSDVADFYHTFYSILDMDEDGEISEEELSNLRDVLGFSELFPGAERRPVVHEDSMDSHKRFWQEFLEFAWRRDHIKPDKCKYSSGHCTYQLERNFRLDMSRNLARKMLKAVLYIDLGDRNKSKYQFRKVEAYQTDIENALEEQYPDTEIIWDHNNKKYPRVTFTMMWQDKTAFDQVNIQTAAPQYQWFQQVARLCSNAVEGKIQHESEGTTS